MMVLSVGIIKVYNKFSDSPAPQQSCCIFFNQRFLESDSSTAYFFLHFLFLTLTNEMVIILDLMPFCHVVIVHPFIKEN